MKRSWVVALVLALALLGGACNEGDDEGGGFELELSGAAEVCDDDAKCGGDGTGTASVDINPDQNEICYEIALDGVEGANAAHIHEGEEGESGDVLIDLAYTGEEGETCVDDVDEGDLEDIAEEPSEFYLNVHTEDLPDGAVRAQLAS